MPKAPINNAGSKAGRGFRYQDAVGVLLALQADVHGEVVAVTEKLFALVPDAEIAAVTAVSADGEPAGLPGTPASESGAYVSDLQSVIHDASSDLLRKFICLPEGHGAFALWTDGLLERVGRAEQEPWTLLGADVAPLFERLHVLVRNMKVIAGEAGSRGQSPALLWRSIAKTARPGNALRLIARQTEQSVVRSLTALKQEMSRHLDERGLVGRVYVRRDDAPSVDWPFATVLVVLEMESISDWHPLVHAHWDALKAAAGDGRRLVLTPLIGGIVASRLTVEGVSMAFPSPHAVDQRLEAEGHVLLEDVHTRRLSSLRPRLERDAREAAAASRTEALDVLLQGVGDKLPDFPSLLSEFLHRIDQGELAFAEQLAASLHGHDTFAGQQVERLQYLLVTMDLIAQIHRRGNDAN